MRQILISIPLRDPVSLGPLGEVTVFGFGIALFLWLTVAVVSLWRVRRTQPSDSGEFRSGLVFFGMGALVILFVPAIAPARFERIPVFGYGAMLVLAAIFSGWTAAKRAPLAGANPDFVWDMAFKLILAGVVGARLFHLIQYREVAFRGCAGPGDYLKAALMLPDGGLVLYGGVILSSVTYFVLCRRQRIDPLKFGDAVVPAVFVGLAFGRLGCFLNGCCFGDVCHLPWAVTFPPDSVPWTALVQRGFLDTAAPASLPLHPTQIYSVLNALVLAFLTASYYRYRKGDGSVVALALMTYSVSRICLEVLRSDENPKFGTGLTISQLVSLGALGLGAVLAWWSWTRHTPKLTSPASDSARASVSA